MWDDSSIYDIMIDVFNFQMDNIRLYKKWMDLWGEETPIYRLEEAKMEGQDWFWNEGLRSIWEGAHGLRGQSVGFKRYVIETFLVSTPFKVHGEELPSTLGREKWI